MNAADLMTRNVLTVSPETPLVDAVRLMLDHRVSGLPVTDPSGALVGVITEGDLLRRAEIGTDANSLSWVRRIFVLGAQAEDYVHTHGRKVGEVMTREPVTVEEGTLVEEVVSLMEHKRIKRLPVVAGGRLVGVVSRADLLRAVADILERKPEPLPSDLAIREQLEAELGRQAWAANAHVTIEVEGGSVRLQGTILDERSRAALRVAVENVPGVTAIVDELVWVDPTSGIYLGVA